ncbi:MAG: 3-phosphoshikimate 1-carboxyvinyltransferase [Prevotella sp.]|nr:3-phosphoshikimate 1-carboxyvinyltransferase [Prevotella sp.]
MTQYRITGPETLRTTVKLPASKSISNRALIIYALAGGGIPSDHCRPPRNLSDCDDTQVMVDALRDMPDIIDIKGAGTAMRFLTAFLAATDSGTHTLTGTQRMQRRPIKILVDALRKLGADIEYTGEQGFPPLRIRGKRLEGGELEIAGNVSSQFVSALLMVAPALEKGLTVRLTGDIISRPYIDLTLCTMREFGADADWISVDTISVEPKPYVNKDYLIENDWSAASYWYEMVALSKDQDAEVRLEGLMDGSKQGDSGVRYIFSLLGVRTIFASKVPGMPTTVTIKKSPHLVPRLEYDFINAPDLAQTFVVTCALMGVPFRFTGLQTLKIKETDRIEALKREMRKLGYVVRDDKGCVLEWNGERCEPQSDDAIDTYEDHRMALAFAPASLRQAVAINSPMVVKKSYPNFWDDLAKAGFCIEQNSDDDTPL